MYEPVHVCFFGCIIEDGMAQLRSDCYTTLPEFLVNFFVIKGEYPHGNGTTLIVPSGEILTIRRKDPYDIPVYDVFVIRLNGPRKYPGMKSP